MKEFVEYLVKKISTDPEKITIKEVEEKSQTTYIIHAPQEDMGVLIGKEGKTIKSIRNLVKAKAIKDRLRVNVVIEEGTQADAQS